MAQHDRMLELLPGLRRYARALTNSMAEADELVRATLERAAQGLADGEGDLRVRLFAQMHEAYVRSSKDGASDEATQVQGFEDAMRALPADKREVFLLVTLEDMSYEDVAKTLNIPLGTVMSRLSRAREKLRLLLMREARLRTVRRK